MSLPFLKDKSPAFIGGLAGMASLAMLLGAFGFQHLGGLHPCVLCIWQRWPHALAAILGGALLSNRLNKPTVSVVLMMGTLIMLGSTGLSFFHVGVEIGVWEGLSSCGTPDYSGTPEQIMAQIEQGVPNCGDVTWRFLGHSMAGWNLFFSAVLSGLWAGQAWKSTR